jgi:hypothetical protein
MDSQEPILSLHLEFNESVMYLLFFTGVMTNIAMLFFIFGVLFNIKSVYHYNTPPRYHEID